MTTVRKEELIGWILAGLIGALLLLLQPTAPITATYMLAVGLVLTLRLFFKSSVRVVKEYERLVVLRLGRYSATRGPGLVVLLPMLDQTTTIDQRQQFQEVPHESCITKDNARIDVDFLFYWRINKPELAVLRIKGLDESLRGLATALLRAVIGDISLDQALAEREHINDQLRAKIDEVTEQWGIEITTVEIREIKMPDTTQDIMSRQMAAERTKRATILEAEGYREAAKLRAEGDAEALMLLNQAATQIDGKTLNIKYLDTLSQLGKGEATKYVLPLELTGLIQRLMSGVGAASPAEPAEAQPGDAPTQRVPGNGVEHPAASIPQGTSVDAPSVRVPEAVLPIPGSTLPDDCDR